MRICGDCADESFLRARVGKIGKVSVCDFCSCLEKTISLKSLATLVKKALQEHYTLADDRLDETEQAIDPETGSVVAREPSGAPITEVIACITGVELDVAERIRSILECLFESKLRFGILGRKPFRGGTRYVEHVFGSYEFDVVWNDFKKDIKERSRFFNESAADDLRAVFGLNKRTTSFQQSLKTVVAKPGDELGSYYRARVLRSTDDVEDLLKNPENELGPPPTEKAAAGRMNALGIPVFYGALEIKTALAEIRPPVGSVVLLGRFKLQREVCLLDLEQMKGFRPRGSVFDPSFAEQREWARFLIRFEDEITRPVQPGDEAFSYLPTQAIADFLANLKEVSLDGIVFKSAQNDGGRNIALFNKSARVKKPLERELGQRRVQVWRDLIGKDNNGAFMIFEEPASATDSPEPETDDDKRPITLGLDRDSIEVHQTKEVTVRTSVDKVTWQK